MPQSWLLRRFLSFVSIPMTMQMRVEVSYDVLTKYLAGETTMDDVDFSTHKLLKSDMEAVKKLKKEPYDDFSLK